MTLYMKCLTCGGWRELPEHPAAQKQIGTGMMMNFATPPANPCSCGEDRRDS